MIIMKKKISMHGRPFSAWCIGQNDGCKKTPLLKDEWAGVAQPTVLNFVNPCNSPKKKR